MVLFVHQASDLFNYDQAACANRILLSGMLSSYFSSCLLLERNLIYLHYHSSIRAELDRMLKAVIALESAQEEHLGEKLTALKRQCRFLEKVYKYHSNVEDEVTFLPSSKKHNSAELVKTQ